jgi:hypothetical protein
MAKNEVGEFDETDANNTDIQSISLAENVMRAPAVNNAFRATMGALKRWFKTSLFRLRDSTDQTKLLAFDLSGFTAATTRTVTFPDSDIDLGNALLVDRRNRVVNGDMRVSQENGTTAGATNGRYPVDQWAQFFVSSAATLTVAQVASVTPAGSPNRIRATVTVADATLAAGEYWTLTQNLEGSNVVDFQYGGSAAKDSVLRFGFKGPAGTYAARLANSAGNRSFVALFTIAAPDANTDTVQEVAIPGDTTGTWLTADGVIGLTLDIVLACGSTFQGAAGWQAGTIFGTSAVSNGMATGAAVFELFDVGFKLDPDATGVYGAYEIGYVHPIYQPQRYIWRLDGVVNRDIGLAYMAASTVARSVVDTGATLAKSPTFSVRAETDFEVISSGGTIVTTAASMGGYSGGVLAIAFTVAAGLTSGQAGYVRFDAGAGRFIMLNSRL